MVQDKKKHRKLEEKKMHLLNNNITRVFNFFKKKLLILMIFILSGVAAVSAYTVFAITPIYSVSSTLIITKTSENISRNIRITKY